MSGDARIGSPGAELEALLAAERTVPELPAEVKERLYLRVRATLGLPPAGGPGGAAGAAGGGSALGGLLAILLATGSVTYLIAHTSLGPRHRTVVLAGGRTSLAGDGAVDPGEGHGVRAERGHLGSTPGNDPRPARRPFQPTSDSARDGAGTAAGPRQEPGAALPDWYGQRDVPAKRIAGQVIDRGQPVTGATVALESFVSAASPALARTVTTGVDGRFDFGLQVPFFYLVSASAPGRQPATHWVHVADPTNRPAPDALVLALGDCTAGIAGTISDDAGRPIPDAVVRMAERSYFGVLGPGSETDASGHFELCLAPGPVRVRVEAEGYGAIYARLVAAAVRPRADLRLSVEGVVEGSTIRFESGEPIPRAQVSLGQIDQPDSYSTRPADVTTISDGNGRFVARGLAPGKYTIDGNAADAISRVRTIVEVKPGQVQRGLVRRMHTTSIVEAVVMAQGKPLGGFALKLGLRGGEESSFDGGEVSSYAGISQPDGRVTLHGVFRGENEFLPMVGRVLSPTAVTVAGPQVTGVVVEVARE